MDDAAERGALTDLENAGLAPAVHVEVVKHSAAELDNVVHRVYSLPGAEAVTSAWHDWANNRAVVTAEHPSDELRSVLYQAYGDAVVVEDEEDSDTLDSRDEDGSPIKGGSRWLREQPNGAGKFCTMGFPWKAAGDYAANYMITAGHCFPKNRADTDWAVNDYGGVDKDYDYFIGATTAGNTTWRDGDGTIDGNGDLARISMSAFNRIGGAYVWTGDWNSTTSRTLDTVKKWAAEGDPACYSGAYSGAWCDYKVYDTDASYKSLDGEVLYQIIKSSKGGGQCSEPGDSGAPVYQRHGDTGAIAFGILSGGGGGGVDHYIGSAEGLFADCHMFFTSIGQAYQQWDGGGEVFTQ